VTGKGRPLLGLKRLTVGNIMSGSSACWLSRAASVGPLPPCRQPHTACWYVYSILETC
jgi:hypothetical protein